MRRPKKEIQLTSYDELLGLEEAPEKSMNQVVEIELEKLHPFKNHPFRVSDDEKMAETGERSKNYGVLNPALVRPRSEGGYELISGHRRKRGCELCGKTTMPVLVRNYTDDEAVIIMVDSNIQRENILPSEKAHAYKMKYDAMKHQGSKGEKYTADMVGETAGDRGRTVQRYIRLASLSDGLLRRTIRTALSSAISFEDFSGKLLQQGVTVKESRGRLSYLTPDRTKPVTARKLGDDFDRTAVLETLTINAQNAVRAAETPAPKEEHPRSIRERLQRNKAVINAPKQDISQREAVQRMVDREAKRAEGKGIGYDRWAAVHNLKQMAATMSIYEESGFSSPEELEAALATASAELNSVHAGLKAVESTLREKKDLQKQLLAYIKTKPARDGLKAQKTEKARKNYREQHESDFMIAEAATRYFKANGITKLPASKTLQAEIEQLMREKNTLYNEYREKREKTKELQTVKGNIEQILRREPERGKGRDNER